MISLRDFNVVVIDSDICLQTYNFCKGEGDVGKGIVFHVYIENQVTSRAQIFFLNSDFGPVLSNYQYLFCTYVELRILPTNFFLCMSMSVYLSFGQFQVLRIQMAAFYS